MLLKRLPLPPHLTPLLAHLESLGVLTTEQVLLAKRDALTPETSEAAIDELVRIILSRVPVERGEAALARIQHHLEDDDHEEGIFGLQGLDELVAPGVIQVCGFKGVGKSLLALHATLRLLASDTTATARWVDTEGAFNAARAQAVITVLGIDSSVLDRLTVSNLFRLEPELFDVLDQVRQEPLTRVLVVDNAAALFRDALMGATAQGHAAMVTAMNEIAELTYSKDLLTIITNSPATSVPSNPLSAFSTTTIKPSLGVSFTFETDVDLLLQDTGRVFGLADQAERDRASSAPGLRVLVEVLKSKVSPSGTWTVFETDGTSLLDVLPPPLDTHTAGETGRPALGPLTATLTPAIAPLRERR